MKLRKLLEEKKKLMEGLESKDILFYITKTLDVDHTSTPDGKSLFSLELRTPNAMPSKFIHYIPNQLSMKIEKELELSIKQIFDKYKKFSK